MNSMFEFKAGIRSKSLFWISIILIAAYSGCNSKQSEVKKVGGMDDKIIKTDEQWRNLLTSEQYYVTRQKGTERAGTGKYAYSEDDGIYSCVCCGLELFSSDRKFDSGTGWPSFDAPFMAENVAEKENRGFFTTQMEVLCNRCDAHLGHVFPDGPRETTGLRYCINSAALKLDSSKEEQ
jgi:peptide-methionine (R)-S-oxide reductase